MSMIMSPVDAIAELFASEGAADYLGEPVTVAAHLLQAGALAQAAGEPPALVAAALLHDVGHLRGADAKAEAIVLSGRELMAGTDNNHGERGAQWLAAQRFPAAVTEPIRLHVAAKRYLCATEPAYFGQLSEASVYTLAVQGGPMTDEEARAFEREPHAADAIAVRRWDDQAKDPAAEVPELDHYRGLLASLLPSA
ncbi:MAG TPA: HD domain-containing protein [Trebonia sp.]|jgi:gamma-butyrobetaine dioxygenase|nr:HD domain-containing protein [Trebonia sp.]